MAFVVGLFSIKQQGKKLFSYRNQLAKTAIRYTGSYRDSGDALISPVWGRKFIDEELPPGYNVAEGEDVFDLPQDQHVDFLDADEVLTPEKRAILAAKYNLRPEDYVPLNQGFRAFGDYPKLPLENTVARDPYYDWDDPYLRRNYGEPILIDLDEYLPVVGVETRPNSLDIYQRARIIWTGLAIIIVGVILGEIFQIPARSAQRQMPYKYPWLEETLTSNHFYRKEMCDHRLKEIERVVEHTFPITKYDIENAPHH